MKHLITLTPAVVAVILAILIDGGFFMSFVMGGAGGYLSGEIAKHYKIMGFRE